MAAPIGLRKDRDAVRVRTAARQAQTRVSIWFQDEMRLGQKNPRTRRWARRGRRPRAVADLRTQLAYLFGAICPELGTGAAVVMPRANTEAMQHQLDEIGRRTAPEPMPSSSSTRPAGTPQPSSSDPTMSPYSSCRPNRRN